MKAITEGLQEQELRDLVHSEIHIDEFQAKMGDDSDMIVVSFKVKYFPAAKDFENFLEKGYNFIIDAETSEGEYENGWYLVFVEIQRRTTFPNKLIQILKDLKNITNVTEWRFKYGASKKRSTPEWEVTEENLKKIIPLSPKGYREIYVLNKDNEDQLDSLLMAAKVNINKNLQLTEVTENIRTLAGLTLDGFEKIKGRPRRG